MWFLPLIAVKHIIFVKLEFQSEKEVSKVCVKDIMTRYVLSVDSSVTANDAAKMMEDTNVGSIIVMENNAPIGIITDRDLAVKVVSHAYPIDIPVKRIMSSPLITTTPEESVWGAAELMHTRKIRKLPVIDNDEVVGIVTATDLVNQFAVSSEEDMKKMYHQTLSKLYENFPPWA